MGLGKEIGGGPGLNCWVLLSSPSDKSVLTHNCFDIPTLKQSCFGILMLSASRVTHAVPKTVAARSGLVVAGSALLALELDNFDFLVGGD